jgi:hypothetical protein
VCNGASTDTEVRLCVRVYIEERKGAKFMI